jgi:hypothetical protein
MSRLSYKFFTAGTALLLVCALTTTAFAQRNREERRREERREEKREAKEDRCKDELVKAAGKATILGNRRAMRLAIDNWQRDVRQKYGERFMDFSKARHVRSECESASIGSLGRLNKRCNISGYPCSTGSLEDDEDVGAGNDTFTIQRWLVRLGYLDRDDIDGDFGRITRRAVEKFQRAEGLRVSGEADEETRRRLRRKVEDRARG